MKGVFIDTGAFLAREIAQDQHHEIAVRAWLALEKASPDMFTSEHVIDETATLLARRTQYAFAGDWGRDVLGSGIKILRLDPDDWEACFRLMRKYADQKVSFTDCVSFVIMKRKRLLKAFSFDQHFTAAGFQLWQGR